MTVFFIKYYSYVFCVHPTLGSYKSGQILLLMRTSYCCECRSASPQPAYIISNEDRTLYSYSLVRMPSERTSFKGSWRPHGCWTGAWRLGTLTLQGCRHRGCHCLGRCQRLFLYCLPILRPSGTIPLATCVCRPQASGGQVFWSSIIHMGTLGPSYC